MKAWRFLRKTDLLRHFCHGLVLGMLFVALTGCCTPYYIDSNSKMEQRHQSPRPTGCVTVYHFYRMDWVTRLAIRGDVRDIETGVPLKGVRVALESEMLVGHARNVVLSQCSDRNGKLSATYETKWGCEQSETSVESSESPKVDFKVLLSLEGYEQTDLSFRLDSLPRMGDDDLVNLGVVFLQRNTGDASQNRCE